MGKLAWLAAMLILVSACGIGASRSSLAYRSPSPVAISPSPSPIATPVHTSPSPTPSPPPAATITCRQGSGGTNLVMIGGQYGTALIYDVSDPVHPRLQCRVLNGPAHLDSGNTFTYLDPRAADRTNIVIHWFADGNEGPAGVIPVVPSKAAWLPSSGLVAYTVRLEPTASSPGGSMQVWLYIQGTSLLLFTYPVGLVGCHGCRFGLPQQVLAVSPDGEYLVAGWTLGKGSDPLAVYRLADQTRMATFQSASALWDRDGHRLFLSGPGTDTTHVWMPESGLSSLAGAGVWAYMAGLSPDGSQIGYTANADPNSRKWRVFIYDQKAATTRLLVDKLRTQVLFVKKGWVWYLEEGPCNEVGCQQTGTVPTGKVFAMQLSTGTEIEVRFAAGENPVMPTSDVNWLPFTPGEFWPAG
ncbi:MAG TPA: hypothetical protein VGU71_06060 [Candidatus Dormibacteraeota bacterium]|nr:hypothetical protein [Candidatus Dormibacteraeota bacterium]